MDTKERNEKIIALVNNGATYQRAADVVGVTRNTVAGVVYRERRELRKKLDRIPEVVLPNFGPAHKSFLRRVFDRVMGAH